MFSSEIDCNSERAVDDAPSLITTSGRSGFILECYVMEIRAAACDECPALMNRTLIG